MDLQTLSDDALVALFHQTRDNATMPSVGAGTTGRAPPPPSNRMPDGFEAFADSGPNPELRAGLDAGLARDPRNAPPAGSTPSLQDLSDDELIDLHRRSTGAGVGPVGTMGQRQPQPAGEGDGLGMNLAAGLNDAMYRTAGAPVDALTWLSNHGPSHWFEGGPAPIENPVGGSQWIAETVGKAGVRDPATVEAVTPAERIARGAGEGVGYAVAPQAMVGGLTKLGAMAPAAERAAASFIGGTGSVGEVAGNAFAGATSGAGSAAAMDAVPERYGPVAGLGGGLAGGAVGTLATGLPRLAREGVRVAGEYMAPATAAGRERIAGLTLRDAATDPHAAADALTNTGELVPGSRPTTFQQSGDMGLGALERRVAAQNPAEFMQRRADQNTARLGAIEGVQPEGHPEAVTQALRARLSAIDDETDRAVRAATSTASERNRVLGPAGGSQEGQGDQLRTILRDAETRTRESERALWKAVDPDGTLALESGSIRGASGRIRKEMPSTAKPMEGEEKAIFDVASRLKPAISFAAMSALRARVTTLMRQEMMTNGQTPVYHRLTQLRGAIQDDVESVVSSRVQQEAQAVASGAMRQEDSLLARMEASLATQRGSWLANRAGGVGQNALAGTGPTGASRASALPSARRADGEGGRGSYDVASDPRVPRDDELLPNFDEAARSRLIAASDATKQRARTFNDGPNGAILRRGANDGPYRLQNAAVPEKLFFPGGRSAENIRRYREAVGDGEAMSTLQDYAVSQLRKVAETPEGMIDPRKLDVWRRRHADALKAFPALDARLSDAGRAAEAAIESGTRRQQALDDYQTGLIGKILGAEHPDDVTRMVGSVFGRQDANALMARLVRETSGNADAVQGLRKAIMNHVMSRYVSNTEAATTGRNLLKSDQLQTFITQNRSVLGRVFRQAELERMQAVADDLQRANRSITAVKLPGGSNTVQDALAVSKTDGPKTIMTKIILASAAAGGTGTTFGGPIVGAAAILGTAATMAMRQAGIHKVEDLIRDAMLHPDRAALLLAKADKHAVGRGPAVALAKRYRQSVIAAAASTLNGQEQADEQR